MIKFLAARRWNIFDVLGIALSAGHLFSEYWVFGWSVLLGCFAVGRRFERWAAQL